METTVFHQKQYSFAKRLFVLSILNSIIGTSVYPNSLKIAITIPIPKARHAMQIEKFRMTALPPIIDKFFEKVLCQQLSVCFNTNKLLYEFQYGFKKGCGTEDALVNVVNHICKG